MISNRLINCICGNKIVHSAKCKRYNWIKNYGKEYYDKLKNKLKEKHLCLNCRKPINPDLCPHCKEILKYKVRCNKCLEKNKPKIRK